MKIQFIDKNGKDINPGDWLKVLCRNYGREYMVFYAQFSQDKRGRLIPYDTFAWESVEKISKKDIPAKAKKCGEDSEYEYYYNGKEEGEDTGQMLSFMCEFDFLRHRKAFKIVEI